MRRNGMEGQVGRCGCGAGHLTAREIEIVRLAATGLSSNQIAAQLSISSRTVDDRLSVMQRRARAGHRGELIARAYAAGILVGWPPHWVGKRCLPARQEAGLELQSPDVHVACPAAILTVDGFAIAQQMTENDVRNPRGPDVPGPRFLANAGGRRQAGVGLGQTLTGVDAPAYAGALVGYALQASRERDLGQQIAALQAIGCRSIFTDKLSVRDRKRPELRRLLGCIRPGDTLVVANLDQLSCSLREIISLVAELRRQGAGLKVLHENLDTTTTDGSVILDMFSALAQLLDGLSNDSTHKGPAAARASGRTGGRPTVMTAEKIAAARALLPGNSIAAIARKIGVSRATLYTHMKAITPAGR